MPEDELSQLFPKISDVVKDWANTLPADDPLRALPDHGGVTAEQMDAWFAQRPGARAPLSPLVSGQNVNGPPEFTPGRSAPPPPPAHVEGSEGQPQTPPVQAQPDWLAGQQEPPAPPPPPDETVLPEQIVVGGHTLPRDKITGLAALDDLLQSDPRLRNMIASYMTTGMMPEAPTFPGPQGAPSPSGPVPGTGEAAAQPTAAPPDPFAFAPPPPDLDLDDPAIKTLWDQQQRTNELLRTIAMSQQNQQQQWAAQQQRDSTAAVEAAVIDFGRKMELDDNQLQEVRRVAAGLNLVDSFMQGMDPVTGLPLPPDVHTAVSRTMEIAYNNIPAFQNRERERYVRESIEDSARKQKLSAIGGGGPQAPRSPQVPNTPEGQRAALMTEVSQMLQGQWSPPSQ